MEWKEEALDDLLGKDEKGSPSIRPTLEHVFIDTAKGKLVKGRCGAHLNFPECKVS